MVLPALLNDTRKEISRFDPYIPAYLLWVEISYGK